MSETSTNQVCPYCGHPSAAADAPCPHCGMRDTPTTRAATTARVGPWSLLLDKNPAAPGMNLATLLSLVRRGQVTPDSVVRGPTTNQLWTRASQVKGLSREFGLCWSCSQNIEQGATTCPHCSKPQSPPTDPSSLLDTKPATPTPRERVPTTLGLSDAPLPTAPSKSSRILTPQELAAAFAIDPPPAPTPEAPAPNKPKPRHTGLAILLLSMLGAVIFLATNTTARTKLSTGLSDFRDWSESHLSRPLPTGKNSPSPTSVDKPQPAPLRATPRPRPIASTKPAIPIVVIGPPSETEDALPATRAAVVLPPEPAPPNAADPPKPETLSPETIQQAIDLFRQALEAESRNDYAAAVKLYQQIKTLPKPAWPGTLERRLTSAQLRTGD